MASSKQFKDFILEQTKSLGLVSKPMMGEYLLYYNGILFGGIYDDRLLIKKTNSNESYFLNEAIPYENAKPMYLVENLDDTSYLNELIKSTCWDLNQRRKL